MTRILRHTYVVTLLAAALVLLFAPAHLYYTVRTPIVETLGSGQVRFVPPKGSLPKVGDTIHLFRYHRDWDLPVGKVRVISTHPVEGVLAQAVDESFRFPVGIQGTIVSELGNRRVRVNVGEDAGLTLRSEMSLFRDGQVVARARTIRVESSDSELELLAEPGSSLLGAHASIYTVPNSVSYLAAPWLRYFEQAGCVALLLLILFRAFLPRRWSRFVDRTRATFAWISRPRILWSFALAPLFVYYGVRFLLRALDLVVASVARATRFPKLAAFACSESMLLYPALIAAVTAFLWVYLETNQSPLRVLRDKTRFTPPTYRWLISKWINRALIVWTLHVVVVAAFAHTLGGILKANIQVMTALSFPAVSPNLSSPAQVYQTFVELFRHGPVHTTWAVSVQALNLFIFSVTILGSLVGYLYAVVAFVWGKECVRNVDFTVTGWLVNAVCYGPLLGVAFWGMIPNTMGSTPGVVDGPIHYLGLGCGLWLNVLYSLSIYNMWTRFGVMVDKGMVENLMFGVVRHPCYTLEGVMFAVMGLGHIGGLWSFASLGLYCLLYWIRSEREEDFMLACNQEYAGYREKVAYKYLPGLI